MGTAYRSWEDRRNIIRSMIAESSPAPLSTFNLSPSEEVYFRARSTRAVDRLARESASFKSYYALPAANPFGYVVLTSALILAFAVLAAFYIRMRTEGGASTYPLL